jgi:hypothetical protein
MSLCFDFQKWTMITLALVAISLSVGLLLQYAHAGTIRIEGIMEEDNDKYHPGYDFPKDGIFEINNSKERDILMAPMSLS